MEYYELNDVTFLIPLRCENEDRKVLVKLVLNFLSHNFNSKIIVLESSKASNVDLSEFKNVTHIFRRDNSDVFFRTKINNILIRKCPTDIGVLLDSDTLFCKNSFLQCINQIRNLNYYFARPYNGIFCELNLLYRNILLKNINFFDEISKTKNLFIITHNSVGGIFIFHPKKYIELGGENENIEGWGHDDQERNLRIMLKGYMIYKTESKLYHLWHTREKNNFFFNEELQKQSYKTLINTSTLDCDKQN